MRKFALIGLFLLALVFASCEDEGSAEINVVCTRGGQKTNCWIEVYNSKGVQVQQVSTQQGIAYIKNVPAGTYTLKFKTHQDEYFNAVKVVTVEDGDSKPVKDFDLDDAPDEGASV